MAVNKVIFADRVLIDLTNDTVKAENLASGSTAHDATGAKIVGTMDVTKETWVFTMKNGTTVTKEVYINA